jgi:hypothetical protein
MTQLIYDAGTQVWILEETDGMTWRELARGQAASQEEAQAAADVALGIVPELDDAVEWGQRIVKAFEAQMMEGGINDNRSVALRLHRYLRDVSDALVTGRIHVASAALDELLATPEAERPAGASNVALWQVHALLSQRLGDPIMPFEDLK